MKIISTASITFNPSAKTVDTGISGFDIRKLYAIINTSAQVIIYATGSTGLGYSNVSGSVITLQFNTASMNAGDVLQVIYDEDFPAVQNVQASALPLPTGAATAANQSSEIAALGQLHTDLTTAPLPAGTNQIGQVVANAGTNLNTSALALESGGNLAAIKTAVQSLDNGIPNALGAAKTANSMPVNVASDQILNTYINNVGVDTYNGSGYLHADPSNAGTEGAAFNSTNFPQTAIVAGKGSDGNVHTIATDPNGNQIVNINGAMTDASSLLNTSLSGAGATSSIDTTGYSSLIIQISGGWLGQLIIQSCNDNSSFLPVYVLNTNEFSMQDVIEGNGNFMLKVSGRYVNILALGVKSGTANILVLGRTSEGLSASDILAFAMDKAQNLPLYVSEVGLKKDNNGALMMSDAPAPIPIALLVNGFQIIDTQGFQSLNITTEALAGNITASDDGITFNALSGTARAIATGFVTAVTANAGFSFPCIARYIKITATTAGTAVAYLRSQPWNGSYVSIGVENITQFGGSNIVTAGVAGIPSIGGNIAPGTAPTTNPVPIGSVDVNGLTRRVLSDVSGRLIPSVVDPQGNYRAFPSLQPGSNAHQVQSVPTADVNQFEGQSQVELLSQLLLEMRITNQLLYQLAKGEIADEPSAYRQEQSLFAV